MLNAGENEGNQVVAQPGQDERREIAREAPQVGLYRLYFVNNFILE